MPLKLPCKQLNPLYVVMIWGMYPIATKLKVNNRIHVSVFCEACFFYLGERFASQFPSCYALGMFSRTQETNSCCCLLLGTQECEENCTFLTINGKRV